MPGVLPLEQLSAEAFEAFVRDLYLPTSADPDVGEANSAMEYVSRVES